MSSRTCFVVVIIMMAMIIARWLVVFLGLSCLRCLFHTILFFLWTLTLFRPYWVLFSAWSIILALLLSNLMSTRIITMIYFMIVMVMILIILIIISAMMVMIFLAMFLFISILWLMSLLLFRFLDGEVLIDVLLLKI